MSESLRHAHGLLVKGDVEGAAVFIQKAAQERPDPFEYQSVRGALHMAKLEFEPALANLDAAASIRPLEMSAHYNIGLCHYELGRFDDAILAYRKALVINPSFAMAWMKLGGAYLASHRQAEALACHERAHGLDPESADIMTAYATSLCVFGDDLAAEKLYRRAWKKDGHHVAECALGFILLRQGKWEEGWKRFAARWQLRNFGTPYDIKNVPLWTGRKEEMAGKRVLLRSEQGFGDTFQFCRYIPWVVGWADKVWLETEPSLASLMGGFGAEVLVRGRDPLPEFDMQTSLMMLPLVFGTTTKANIPSSAVIPVRSIDPGAEIGVCWHGGSRPWDPMAHADDQRRSIALETFMPILEQAPCVSLQEDDLRAAGVTDWRGTAERIAGLKLVITVDTAIAHLAATLGVDTWCLVRAAGCWRWLNHGDTTVWYPNMKLYRQPVLDAWEPVVAQVVRDLRRWRTTYVQTC